MLFHDVQGLSVGLGAGEQSGLVSSFWLTDVGWKVDDLKFHTDILDQIERLINVFIFLMHFLVFFDAILQTVEQLSTLNGVQAIHGFLLGSKYRVVLVIRWQTIVDLGLFISVAHFVFTCITDITYYPFGLLYLR